MKILITGAQGFISKNLTAQLNNIIQNKVKDNGLKEPLELYLYGRHSSEVDLERYTKDCDFVFHFAGVNRPEHDGDFMKGNYTFTQQLLEKVESHGNKAPILFTSSIQAESDSLYGRSKKAGEDLIFQHGKSQNSKVFIYRLPNVFGKWCKPDYNSVVATFCHRIARGLQIKVNDPEARLNLVYIDDVIEEFISCLCGEGHIDDGGFGHIPRTYFTKVGDLAALLYSFKSGRESLSIPKLDDGFESHLYSTYLSYLPEKDFCYSLKMNTDDRGSFTEIMRTLDRGQFSVNISKPGIIKGNHWHHSKNEKFLVVNGEGLIRLRKIGNDRVVEYHVSGKRLEIVDIPPGYTHNIINLGDDDLITFMWCNECFDPNDPDTYFEEV